MAAQNIDRYYPTQRHSCEGSQRRDFCLKCGLNTHSNNSNHEDNDRAILFDLFS